jgi:uncharacterized membrane protein YjjP (DUF1212 family)
VAVDDTPFGALVAPPPALAGALDAGDERSADPPELVMRLGRALHAAGSPANRIEEGMEAAARRLGIAGQYFSTPTALFASFADARGGRRTILERVQPGEVNLERMSDFDELLGRLAEGQLEPREAAAELRRFDAAAPRYGALLTTLSFALASGAAAQFLGGGLREIAAATAVGLLTGVLATLATRTVALGRLFEPLAALLASLVATVAGALLPLSVFLVALAGLIVLLPGLTLTVSISELASRQLVSGSARLAGAVALFFAIALGVAVGSQVGAAIVGGHPAVVTPQPLGEAWRWAALLAAGLSFTVLLRARPRDVGWVLLAGVLAIQGVRLGAHLLGPQLSAFAGALLVGIAGNLYARLLRRPAAVLQVPGLLVLVPGSLGVRSLQALLEKDVLSGVQTAFATTLVAIALATGILLANVVIPPRRLL